LGVYDLKRVFGCHPAAIRATVEAAYAEHAGRRPDAGVGRDTGSRDADTGTEWPDMA
jgi:hypothetical protein